MSFILPINPIQIENPTGQIAWQIGWALDLHTNLNQHITGNGSEKRTNVGECLYEFKYRDNHFLSTVLAKTAAEFIRNDKHLRRAEVIVSIPPSKKRYGQHPVACIAAKVASLLSIPYVESGLRKVKETPELKDERDPDARKRILKGAFQADSKIVKGKEVLVIDDVYRSGATLSEAAIELRENGGSKYVYVLTLTKTRTNR